MRGKSDANRSDGRGVGKGRMFIFGHRASISTALQEKVRTVALRCIRKNPDACPPRNRFPNPKPILTRNSFAIDRILFLLCRAGQVVASVSSVSSCVPFPVSNLKPAAPGSLWFVRVVVVKHAPKIVAQLTRGWTFMDFSCWLVFRRVRKPFFSCFLRLFVA